MSEKPKFRILKTRGLCMKHSKQDYIDLDLFNGGFRNNNVKMVRTRKEHKCVISDQQHAIKIGSRARVEKAVYQGKWNTCYACIPCMDLWFEEQRIS